MSGKGTTERSGLEDSIVRQPILQALIETYQCGDCLYVLTSKERFARDRTSGCPSCSSSEALWLWPMANFKTAYFPLLQDLTSDWAKHAPVLVIMASAITEDTLRRVVSDALQKRGLDPSAAAEMSDSIRGSEHLKRTLETLLGVKSLEKLVKETEHAKALTLWKANRDIRNDLAHGRTRTLSIADAKQAFMCVTHFNGLMAFLLNTVKKGRPREEALKSKRAWAKILANAPE